MFEDYELMGLHPLLSVLTDDQLKEVSLMLSVKEHKKGTILFKEGDKPDNFFFDKVR